MPNCKICGKPVVSGVVLHSECLDEMVASKQNGQSAIDRSEMLAKIAHQLNEEIENIREIIVHAKAINAENIKLEQENERLKSGGWISVEERLPENSNNVLIAHRQGVTTGWYLSRWVGGHGKSHTLRTVTHWMPLPAPPEDKP